MQNIRLIRRRFQHRAGTIIGWLTILSLSALALGIGWLLLG
jgi:hypothetical protein